MTEETGRYRKIVVPIDGSGWSQSAIPHAVDIAHNNHSEIILLHVFRPPAYEYTDQIALAGNDDQIQQMREQIKQHLMGIRNQLRLENINCRVQFIEGQGVANLICDYINEEGVDLVIMSTHGRSGIRQFLFGSIAQKVLHGVKVPVMVVQPGKD